MTLVLDKFKSLIPSRAKSSPSGWTSFNAPCCHHRGHSPDKRKRGGVRFDTGLVYNCFNCKYTASWQPGRTISNKLKTLCQWMGASDEDIKELIFEALKTESPEYEAKQYEEKVEFTEKELPEGSLPVADWLEVELDDNQAIQLANVVEYVLDRGFNPTSGDFYWSPLNGYESRVIVPFKYKGKVVGNTARKVTKGNPKYLSDQHPHFVFNVDKQQEEQKYVFVMEGPFDAMSIGGMALLTNDIHDQQHKIINSLGSEVIVIPDQDKAGINLIKKASELGWSVAFPNWDDDVKDVADAVSRYGKLFVMIDAIKTAQDHPVKINIALSKHEQKLKRLEDEEIN
jgi:hypothetical protein